MVVSEIASSRLLAPYDDRRRRTKTRVNAGGRAGKLDQTWAVVSGIHEDCDGTPRKQQDRSCRSQSSRRQQESVDGRTAMSLEEDERRNWDASIVLHVTGSGLGHSPRPAFHFETSFFLGLDLECGSFRRPSASIVHTAFRHEACGGWAPDVSDLMGDQQDRTW